MCGKGVVCGRGACVTGGCAWQGACVMGGGQVAGGMCGRGLCMAGEGECVMGVCVVGGMHGKGCAWQGGHAWHGACMAHMPHLRQILRDVVNERAVRILLECILVAIKILVVYRVTLVVTLAFFAPNFLGRKR